MLAGTDADGQDQEITNPLNRHLTSLGSTAAVVMLAEVEMGVVIDLEETRTRVGEVMMGILGIEGHQVKIRAGEAMVLIVIAIE